MLFTPKKSKFKKQQKGKLLNVVYSKEINLYKLKIGSVGLRAMDTKRVTSKQIEAMRKTIKKLIKRTGRLIIKFFPNRSVTKKPIEVRMGKGKGSVNHWIFKIKPGFILCEVITHKINAVIFALKILQKKLTLKTKIILN